MLSDEQLIEQIRTELRSELADLNPQPGLLDRLLEPAGSDGRLLHVSVEWPAGRDRRRWRGPARGAGAAVPLLAVVIVAVVVAAVALTSLRSDHSSTPASTGIAANNGQIAFVSGWSLEFANPDGSGLRDLGAVQDQCAGPPPGACAGCFAWSPDGRQFAYLAGGSHKLTLYLVGADGRHPRRLTACGGCQGVSWSPDGSHIAVGRQVAGQLNVWVVSAKSGAMRRITDCRPTSTTCGTAGYVADVYWFQPQWSPNGQEISFRLYGVPKVGGALVVGPLDTVRPDGSDLTELPFPNPTPDPEAVQWSPDGRELAVNTADGVYIVDAAGTARWLTNIPGTAGVAWSPDGQELAIADNAGGIYGIYTIDADGKALTRLDGHAFFFLSPAWSPNGKELAYQSETGQNGVVGIWTIRADGSDRRLIYKTMPQDGGGGVLWAGPSWSPDGSQLAFSSNPGTYVVNADGTHLHRIGQGSFGALAWQPNPSSR